MSVKLQELLKTPNCQKFSEKAHTSYSLIREDNATTEALMLGYYILWSFALNTFEPQQHPIVFQNEDDVFFLKKNQKRVR